jgi:hypothetical protein
MGYRSDRRFANLLCTKALEAAQLIRPRRADFHQGQEHLRKLRFKAEYMAATDYTHLDKRLFARGWVHICKYMRSRRVCRS